MTEAELQSLVREVCRTLGLTAYHTHRSDRSDKGFPDLVIVGQRILYRELKSATGKVTPEQKHWLAILRDAGQDADVWRPADWPDRIVAELRALGRCRPAPQPTQAQLKKKLTRRATPARSGA